MVKNVKKIAFANIPLNSENNIPLYQQLYDGLREAILSGSLKAKTRLPSTRTLAKELNVSRNTVMNAFEQLLMEGYLVGKIGSGTYVAQTLPDELLHTGVIKTKEQKQKNFGLSKRGEFLASIPVSLAQRYRTSLTNTTPFQNGLPAYDAFPFERWSKMLAKCWKHLPRKAFGYGSSAGYKPLREAIANHLATTRAVKCSAEQVIIVSGSQQALDLASRLLLDPQDIVWVEDPCYMGARSALQAAGAKVVPIPVDNEGINVAYGEVKSSAKLVYVTPSHQFPLGMAMSLQRRVALLEWASHNNAWILEDDYDSDFRYIGRPIASLQGLDSEGRVIYIGTFSKVLSPTLRLGYVVVPLNLVDAFSSARALSDRHSPQVEQMVLTDFIAEGYFSQHIRRMRALYSERQEALIEAVKEHLLGFLSVYPSETGMHTIGWLPDKSNDLAISETLMNNQIIAYPLSMYTIEAKLPPSLLLGYSGFSPEDIYLAVKKMARVLEYTK
ncbi:MAG: PLP-dependent aminotransferase family protein [Acidobacteria bacterium]|nr:PLP-dependent aminotransferase family protein [Acidobacteriota bacterium]